MMIKAIRTLALLGATARFLECHLKLLRSAISLRTSIALHILLLYLASCHIFYILLAWAVLSYLRELVTLTISDRRATLTWTSWAVPKSLIRYFLDIFSRVGRYRSSLASSRLLLCWLLWWVRSLSKGLVCSLSFAAYLQVIEQELTVVVFCRLSLLAILVVLVLHAFAKWLLMLILLIFCVAAWCMLVLSVGRLMRLRSIGWPSVCFNTCVDSTALVTMSWRLWPWLWPTLEPIS